MWNSKVYSSSCDSYEYDKIKKIVFEHFDKIISEKYADYNFDSKHVVIKPNLLAKRSPAAGITTDPSFVRAACEYFATKGASVVICDSPGGVYNHAAVNSIYNVCGMTLAAEQSGALLNFDFGHTVMTNENGIVSKTFNIINPLANADFVVNLARLKTHSLCNMSAAVKNLYGSVPGLEKAEQHARFPDQNDFSRYLIDLCLVVKPNISLVDAIVAMEGNGPAGGTLKKVGLVLSSSDPFVLDMIASRIMDYSTSDVLTVRNSVDLGLCPGDYDEIEVVGADYKNYLSHFKRPDSSAGGLIKQLPSLFGGRIRKMLEPRPHVSGKLCVGCGECAKCCPEKTIEIINKKAVIKYDKCIRCYCCQELCPMKAVSIKRNPFMKL